MENFPTSIEPVSDDNIGAISFSAPVPAPTETSVNSCSAMEPAPAPSKIVSAYINPALIKVVNSQMEGDDILIEIGLDVSVNDLSNATGFKTGTVMKTLKFSKASLEAELLSSLSKPVTTVESKKDIKSDAQRLRELAGIPGKGNWV